MSALRPFADIAFYPRGIHKQMSISKGSHDCDQMVSPIQLFQNKAYLMVFALELDIL